MEQSAGELDVFSSGSETRTRAVTRNASEKTEAPDHEKGFIYDFSSELNEFGLYENQEVVRAGVEQTLIHVSRRVSAGVDVTRGVYRNMGELPDDLSSDPPEGDVIMASFAPNDFGLYDGEVTHQSARTQFRRFQSEDAEFEEAHTSIYNALKGDDLDSYLAAIDATATSGVRVRADAALREDGRLSAHFSEASPETRSWDLYFQSVLSGTPAEMEMYHARDVYTEDIGELVRAYEADDDTAHLSVGTELLSNGRWNINISRLQQDPTVRSWWWGPVSDTVYWLEDWDNNATNDHEIYVAMFSSKIKARDFMLSTTDATPGYTTQKNAKGSSITPTANGFRCYRIRAIAGWKGPAM